MENHYLGIDTAFATMSDQPIHNLGVLGQPSAHSSAMGRIALPRPLCHPTHPHALGVGAHSS